MKLSRNFTLTELTKSDTAIRKGINNNPNAEQIEKLKALCENILQPVRDHFGRVKVTSGFRSVLNYVRLLAAQRTATACQSRSRRLRMCWSRQC